ncbi:MAG: OmpA family protein [Gemmatimonadota bacterium]
MSDQALSRESTAFMRCRVRRALAAIVVATLAFFSFVASAAAQDRGTIEVSAFAQRTAFDEGTTLTFGTAPGLGASLGVFPMQNVSLELATSFTWTHPEAPPRVGVSWVPLRVRAVYHVPATETFYPMLGVGLVRNGYGNTFDNSDSGAAALLGFKTYINDRLAFRGDVQLDLVGGPFNEGATVNGTTVTSHSNWTLSAGLSYDFGRGRFRDTDGDGVHDRRDLCPATPSGVSVGADGCRLDEDGDGVFDEDDRCPLTPPGVSVDRSGCRLDGDGDRVFDEDDRCPATPRSVAVDPDGCALDTDRDRVPDYQDECAGTPFGVGVDAVGCRLDEDGDGVWDEDDLCPGTAAGIEVDEDGCQILFEEEEVVLVLEGVTFETASAELTEEAQRILDGIASALVANPEIRVRVSGHTDSIGERAYNISLSQSRAESVASYLSSRGVASERMEAQGFGPDQPVATNGTSEGRAQNRRVELERIDEG